VTGAASGAPPTSSGPEPRGLRRFGAVFADRRVRWATAGAVTGRLAQTILPLALLLAVEDRLHDFAAAGTVVATYALASAAGAPVVGRLVDRWGAAVLVGFAVLSAAATAGLAFSSTVPVMIGFAAAAGVTTPPLGASLRAVVVRALPERTQAAALSLDSVATEVLFIVGPTVAGAVAAAGSPAAALFACAALMLAGAVIFVPSGTGGTRRTPVVGARRPPSARVFAALAPVLIMAVALTFTVGLVEVGVTARAQEWRTIESAGPLLGLWAVGSVVGGLLYGGRDWPGSARAHALILMPAVGFGFAVPSLAGSVAVMYPLMVLAGLAVAPALTNLARLVASRAPADSGTEAFAWLGASTALGGAAGVAVAGVIVERWSGAAGLWTAGAVAVAATVLVPLLRPHRAAAAAGGSGEGGPGGREVSPDRAEPAAAPPE